MIVIVIGLLRTNLSGLYRHRRGLGFTWSRLQGRKYNIRIAKLVFHAKESPIRTRAGVLRLVSSRFNSPDDVYSPAVRIPPNPGLPQPPRGRDKMTYQPAPPRQFTTARGNMQDLRDILENNAGQPRSIYGSRGRTTAHDADRHIGYNTNKSGRAEHNGQDPFELRRDIA